MLSIILAEAKILCLIFLLTCPYFAILHAQTTKILIQNSKEDNQSEADILCQNGYTATFNYDYNRFCPNLIKKIYDHNPSMENPNPKLPLQIDQLYSEEKHKAEKKKEAIICPLRDPNVTLLASVISNHRWDFTGAIQNCRHDSLKFAHEDVPCELNGDTDTMPLLRINPDSMTAFFSEITQICTSESQFLLLIFKVENGLVCFLKVQQHKVDHNVTENECNETENSSSCGVYNCSSKIDVYNQLTQMTRQMKFLNMNGKSEFQFQKPNHSDEMKEKTSIGDYFFELLLLAFVIILLATCCLTNCLGLNNPSQANYSRRESLAAPTNEIGTSGAHKNQVDVFGTSTLPNQNCNYKLKCTKKPACVCVDGRKDSKSKKMKWGARGDEESYAPVRQDNSSKYIPTIIRG